MKVWIVTTESVYGVETTTSVDVFSAYDKAKAAFDCIVKEERENDHLFNKNDVIVEENDEYFCIYEDGFYCEDHFIAKIIEKEVR